MKYELPNLKYNYTDLEPIIDAQTMEIHYTKHHQGYTNNLNAALEGHEDLQEMSIEELLRNLGQVEPSIRDAVQNNGGGYHNHLLFWESMTPGGSEMSEELKTILSDAFGSVEAFKEQFEKAAASRFGSGWCWLAHDGGNYIIVSTPNQNSPLSENRVPLLGLDVWEHAYYLKYQNRRAEYIKNWWQVVDWSVVEERIKNNE